MNKEQFLNSLKELEISYNPSQIEQLEQYYELLITYNQVMNLTGITEKNEVYLKHFYDSLTIVKAIDLKEVTTLCDVGSGAGFPGIVLKIFFPHLKITLVDSLQKRVQFLKTVIDTLELKDIEAIHTRVEEYARENRNQFDVVTARAVASLNLLLEYCIPLVKVNGYFISLKGNISEEIKNSSHALQELHSTIIDTCQFTLPYENSIRSIINIKKQKDNLKYPRKFSEIKKRPL